MGDDLTQTTQPAGFVRAKYLKEALRRGTPPILSTTEDCLIQEWAPSWDEGDPIVQKAYLDQLVECAPEAITILDPSHRVMRINSEFTRMMLTLGSSTAIVAHNLAALGCKVGFISRIGTDALGQIALERLSQGGVDVSKVRKAEGNKQTGLTVILQREKERNILTYPGTIFDLTMRPCLPFLSRISQSG